MIIERLISLDEINLESLLKQSLLEGYRFVQKLVDEYSNGINRFERVGESLFVVKHENEVIAIGGLNIDPYLEVHNVGRVRHLYVLPRWRGSGVGKKLLKKIIEEARGNFSSITLYTDNPVADHLYRSVGFIKAEGIYKASHILDFT